VFDTAHMKAFDRSKEEAGSDIAALLDHTFDQPTTHEPRRKANSTISTVGWR
jgi:hypothetical protein